MAAGMSFADAHDIEKPAPWMGAHEQLLLSPETGIVSRRRRTETQAQQGDSGAEQLRYLPGRLGARTRLRVPLLLASSRWPLAPGVTLARRPS